MPADVIPRRTADEPLPAATTTGWHTDGSIGVLRPVVASPTEAIARCDRLLDTVRAAVRADALQPAPRVNVGLALSPRRSSGAGALFDAAGIAVRSAARMGGDQWAAA